MGYAAAGSVGGGPAQFLVGNFGPGNGLDHIRAGNIHLPAALHHKDKVGDGRGIDGPAGRRPHNNRNLRHYAGIQGIPQKNIAIGPQADHALLDTRPAGVVEADHRAAGLAGQIHHLADFFPHHLGKGAAEHGKILGIGKNLAALHPAAAGDHGIAEDFAVSQAEIGRAVGNKGIDFLKGAVVHQAGQAFPGSQLAAAALLFNALRPAA